MSALVILSWQVPELLKRPWFTFLEDWLSTEEAGVVLIIALLVVGGLGFWLW